MLPALPCCILFMAMIFPFSGNLLAQTMLDWAKKIPGPYDFPSHLINEEGDIYCAGVFEGVVDFDSSPSGVFQMNSNNGMGYVLKLNSSGGFIWAVQFQSQHAPVIALDADGNVYVGGNTSESGIDLDPGPGQMIHNNTLPGLPDVFIVKLNTAGTFIWGKAMGSQYLDTGDYIAVDTLNGGVYIGGFFYGGGDFDPGPGTFTLTTVDPNNSDQFILKLNANGDFEWAFSAAFQMYAMTLDSQGDLLVGGSFQNTFDFDPGADTFQLTSGVSDGFLLKLSSAGTFQWAKQFATPLGGSFFGCSVQGIAIDQAGNCYLAGNYSSETDFDPGLSVYQLPYNPGNYYSFVLKLNPAGDFIWARGFAQPLPDYALSWLDLCTDAEGNVYGCGSFSKNLDFDPGNGVFNMTSAGETDMFLLKLMPDGTFDWAVRIGGTSYDHGKNVNVANDNQVTVTGFFKGPADLDPGPGTNYMSGGFDGSGFLLKLSQIPTPVIEAFENQSLSVYPNPASGYIELRLTEPVKDGIVSICTTTGAVLLRQPVPADGRINVSGLPPGAYVLRLEGQQKSVSNIFIKQ